MTRQSASVVKWMDSNRTFLILHGNRDAHHIFEVALDSMNLSRPEARNAS
jgi:hypothetical protein